MGQISNKRVIIIIFCLIVTGLVIYLEPSSNARIKQVELARAMSRIDGWPSSENILLDSRIVEALNLDDYANLTYSNGTSRASLYIGYYLTSKKVGAAHSPLVCFTGQGWLLSESTNEFMKIGEAKINFTKMIASNGSRKELLIFWFQSFDRTSCGTFWQKINTLWAKLRTGREDNAFVRITVPMDELTSNEAYTVGRQFMMSFYPRFLEYIKGNASNEISED